MDTVSYKCPSCGGSVVWKAQKQKMVCQSCAKEYTEEQLKSVEQGEAFDQKTDGFQWHQEEMVSMDEVAKDKMTYHCESCGAEIIGDENLGATTCPYCDSPIVLAGRVTGQDQPNYVIPFQLNKEEAMKKLEGFYKRKPLLPRYFKQDNRLKEVKGIYIPFWLFDSSVEGSGHYRATRSRFWTTGNVDYEEISHFDIFRSGHANFSKVPTDASTKTPDNLMDTIEPYDYSKLSKFDMSYLSGFLADKYDQTVKECENRAESRIKNSLSGLLKNTISGYDTVREQQFVAGCEKSDVHYALFPVWMLTTRYKDKPYTFSVNGQTGKVAGNLPISKAKLFGFVIPIAVAVFGIAQLFI